MSMRAVWNGAVLAESDDTHVVEGNHYFPPDSLRQEHFTPSAKTTVCPWKGTASYYSVTVNGATNPHAAWYYPDPSPEAEQIKDWTAFWNGVEIVDAHEQGD